MKIRQALVVAIWMSLLSACQPAPPEVEPASKDVAMTCLQANDLACAEANLRGYLKQYPTDSETTAILAIALTRAGKHREALPFYARAVEAGEATYDLFAFYAKSLDVSGDLAGSMTFNRKSLQIVPSLVDVRGDLARQLVRNGQPKEAIELLRSYDDDLKRQGHPPYFTVQIVGVEEGMKK
jgi:Flp pilus assembly protein TadD